MRFGSRISWPLVSEVYYCPIKAISAVLDGEIVRSTLAESLALVDSDRAQLQIPTVDV